MKRALLENLLGQIRDDPQCIQQLRKVVVALAITGRLDAAASTSSVACVVSQAQAQLTNEVSQRHNHMPAALAADQLPGEFLNPSCFVSLSAISRIEKGLTGIQQARPGPFPLVTTANNRSTCDCFDFEGAAAIVPLVSSAGHGKASINRLHYQEGRFALGTILAAVFPRDPIIVSARFLFAYLSAFKEELLVTRMTGTANVTLTLGRLGEVPVPLVPFKVQQIVDQLMALCDRLEAARTAREATRDRLSAASLARLNTPDSETFPTDARFALDALPALTTRPDQIKQLRQTILSLAVRGKLVPQDAEDEPAAGLLARLRHKRKVKRKALNHDEAGALLPELPRTWLWTSVDEIAADWDNAITDGPFGSQLKTEHYVTTPGFRVVRLQNIGQGTFVAEHRSYVDQSRYERLAKHHVMAGDLVVAGLVDPRVRCCQLPADIGPALVKADCYRFSVDQRLVARFALFYLNSLLCQEFATAHHHGMTLTRIGLGNFRTLPFPLPPLAEQHRIVAKVNALMALCDQLEASLITASTTRVRLLEATLRGALLPAEETLLEAAQ